MLKPTLRFGDDHTFKIVQFTDIHWKNGEPEDQMSRRAWKRYWTWSDRIWWYLRAISFIRVKPIPAGKVPGSSAGLQGCCKDGGVTWNSLGLRIRESRYGRRCHT